MRNISMLALCCLGHFAGGAAAQPSQGVLPLDPGPLSTTVGDSLEVLVRFFDEFATTVSVDAQGQFQIANAPTGADYRLARDASIVLQRAAAYRLLTCGSADLAQLLELSHGTDEVARRGAVWLLTREPDLDAPISRWITDQLDDLRRDPDALVRATLASLPHAGTGGALDENAWVRAAWWKGFHAGSVQAGGDQLTSAECQSLRDAMGDVSPFVRRAARLAHERLTESIPADQVDAVTALIAGLEKDPSPWARAKFENQSNADPTIGWMSSLERWSALPWNEPLRPPAYRNGRVGNPGRLVGRLEFLQSALNVQPLPVKDFLEDAEPVLVTTALAMHWPESRLTPDCVALRAQLLVGANADVRLAASLTFDVGAGYPYPAELIPEVRAGILQDLDSDSRWDNYAAVALARGVRGTHPQSSSTEWVADNLLTRLATYPQDRRDAVIQVIRALLGEVEAAASIAAATATPPQEQPARPEPAATPESPAPMRAVGLLAVPAILIIWFLRPRRRRE